MGIPVVGKQSFYFDGANDMYDNCHNPTYRATAERQIPHTFHVSAWSNMVSNALASWKNIGVQNLKLFEHYLHGLTDVKNW